MHVCYTVLDVTCPELVLLWGKRRAQSRELSDCFFFQAEDGIRDWSVTGVQTCALPIWPPGLAGGIIGSKYKSSVCWPMPRYSRGHPNRNHRTPESRARPRSASNVILTPKALCVLSRDRKSVV